MKVDIRVLSFWGAHLAIMADIDGNVAPSHTPIKALITITSHGKSLMSPTRVATGNNKLEKKI